MQLGHDVRLVPPIYVKPFVKRQKNDAADAEAICEAAQRPTMRFVAVKGEEQQARAMLFHTRDLLVAFSISTAISPMASSSLTPKTPRDPAPSVEMLPPRTAM